MTSIKICLYRTAKNSRVVEALINALHNGKRVTAVVELAARFDEHANIEMAQRLTEAGVEVIFGIPGLKVHCKLFSIERREEKGIRYYSHIGTGNFNEKTARLYTDFSCSPPTRRWAGMWPQFLSSSNSTIGCPSMKRCWCRHTAPDQAG